MKKLIGLSIAFLSFFGCVCMTAFAPWWIVLPVIGGGLLLVTVAKR